MIFSIIIPTHNRADALLQTLEHLSRQQFVEKWEVIVVNNNCTDETDEVVKSLQVDFPTTLELVHEKKPGAAAARNAGAKIAKGEFLVFIDNDILTKPDFLAGHLKVLQANPGCWLVGAITNLPEQEKSPFGQFRKSLAVGDAPTKIEETMIFTGANSSLPRRDFEKIGGFDENFHVASGEDQEMAMRARKQLGIKTIFVPEIIGIHNDWAGWTFADFCLRQQIYARTEYFFWQKYGDEHPRLQMMQESLPVNWREDPFGLKIRKFKKNVVGTQLSQSFLLYASNLLEKSQIFRSVLWIFYKLRLAGAINNGLKEGRNHFLSNN